MDPRLYKQLHEMERTHWWFAGRRKIILATLERFAVEATSVLDVGCGAGTNLDLIGERYPSVPVHGIDVELEPLRFCRADRAVPVYQADVARLPFKQGVFDLVTAFDNLEHVEDDRATLGELFRVCAPGGTLVLTVPAFPFLWGNIDEVGHHYRRYTRAEIARKISEAGFSIRSLRFFNSLLFAPIAAVRLAARLVPSSRTKDGDRVRSDLDLVKAGPLNTLLTKILGLEADFLGVEPPFGVSLLCVARRD